MDMIAYYRVSTDKQGVLGLGMEAQHEAVRRYAAGIGAAVVASYTEVESGTRSNRPQLAMALAHARRARATLCVAKLDRLARNVHFLSGLMESGVEFVACDQPHATRFTLHILAAVAEHESRIISERTKAALAAYKARGGVLGGRRADSSTMPPETLQRGREAGSRALRARAVAEYAIECRIATRLRGEGLSLQAIADRLNVDGFRTVKGSDWSKVQVKRMLDRSEVH